MYSAIKSAFALLTAKQRREYWLVAVLLSITAIADLIGIAAVIPAISSLIDFESAVEKGYLHTLYVWLGEPEKSKISGDDYIGCRWLYMGWRTYDHTGSLCAATFYSSSKC